MNIDRNLYPNSCELKYYPEWQCPECNAGKLSVADNGLKTYEYPSSSNLHDDEAWNHEWIRGCFIGILICGNSKCKCKVVFSGDMFVEPTVQEIDQEPYHVMAVADYISPKYFNPPLEVIPVPDFLPDKIARCLKETFKFFWADNSSCANKIRIMVEAIMTEQKIPNTYINKFRKRKPYKLHERIVKFQNKNADVGELLLAAKWIGNEGSHELNKLEREDILIAYEIINQCIEKLYNRRPKEIQKIAKKINRNKGI
jgi:hypothetical protein